MKMHEKAPYLHLVAPGSSSGWLSEENYIEVQEGFSNSGSGREYRKAMLEIAAGKETDGMDDTTKILLDKMDRDIREHKQETRDRDARLQSEMQERENRLHKELAEREERIVQLFKEVKADINNVETRIEARVSRMEQHFDLKMNAIEQKTDNTYKHISSITIATICGIGACVVAIAAVGVGVWLK